MERFQVRLDAEERREMHRRLEQKLAAEQRLAVVLQPLHAHRVAALTLQVLMANTHTVANVMRFLRRQLCVAADRALYIYSGEEKLLRPNINLRELSRSAPSEDGMLYLYYADAPAFGSSAPLPVSFPVSAGTECQLVRTLKAASSSC